MTVTEENASATVALQEIGDTNKRFTSALADGDAATMAACYTAAALLLPPGYPAVSGRDGIREFWSAGIAAGLRSVVLETLDIQVFADTALEVGRATAVVRPAGAAPRSDVGKYVVVHKRENGSWLWAVDIFNFDGAEAS
jgi:uncharacterized protein (TIGR02246 family)